ncbi:protein FAM193A-like isoform X2 [Lineus longissimus]|uniref:protein FAM193A-like isoform X2 n=1 Tax=Lineus longissimus TaxID=88925 RepID=UPI00315DF439
MSSVEGKRSKKRKNKKNKLVVGNAAAAPQQQHGDDEQNSADDVLKRLVTSPAKPATGTNQKDLEVIERVMDADDDQDDGEGPALLNGSNPYLVGERCLLCMCERTSSPQVSADDDENSSSLGIVSQHPLWVCAACRKKAEDDEKRAISESRSDMEPPSLPDDLSNLEPTTPEGNMCTCQACTERRQIQAEHEKETQQLQQCWVDLRQGVRSIYRNAGTKKTDDQDVTSKACKVDIEKMKEFVHRLCTRDAHQLFQRLESQGREYVIETKVKLFKQLTSGHKTPPQAKAFVALMLEEYSSLSSAAKILASFLSELEQEHLKRFNLTWELHNKHLFQNIVYTDSLVQSSLPMLMAQLRLGAGSREAYHDDTYRSCLQRYLKFDDEMSVISVVWRDCQQLIDEYNDEQAALKARQKMLKDDWEFFKAQKLIEQQVLKSTKVSCNSTSKTPSLEAKFTETMRHLLQGTAKQASEDCHCPNCNRKRCPCDECTISHMITCGILTPEMTENMTLSHQPMFTHDPSRYVIDVNPPSMSSTSSSSGSSSPSPSPIDRKSLALPFEDSIDNFDADDNEFDDIEDSDDDSFPSHLLKRVELESEDALDSVKTSTSSSPVPAPTAPKCDCSHCSAQEQTDQLKSLENTCQCDACSQQTGKAVPMTLPQHMPAMPRPAALHLYPHIHGSNTLHSLHAGHVGHVRPFLHPHLYDLHVPMKQPKSRLQSQKKRNASFDVDLPDSILQDVYTYGEWDTSPSFESSIKQTFGTKYNGTFASELFNMPPPPLLNGSSFMNDISLSETLPKTSVKMSVSVPVSSHATSVTKTSSTATTSVDSSVPDCFKNLSPINRTLLSQTTFACRPAQSSAATTALDTSMLNSDHCTKHNPFFHNHNNAYSGASTSQTTTTTLSPAALAQTHGLQLKFINAAKEGMSKTYAHSANISLPRGCTNPFSSCNNLNQLSGRVYQTNPVLDPNTGTCASSVSMPTSVNNVAVGNSTVCTDHDCDGHNEETYDSIDDSCSEQSSSTSNSNQKDGKYCDCCYCELLGHGSPTGAPANRNSSEIRERLRLRLKRKNETKHESPSSEGHRTHILPPPIHRHVPVTCSASSSPMNHEPIGTKGLDELIKFINGEDSGKAMSSKAAKRARQKQRKLEERKRKEEARKKENLSPCQRLSACTNATADLPETLCKNSQASEESPHLERPSRCSAYNHHSSVMPMDESSGPQTENVQQKHSLSKNCVMVMGGRKYECQLRENQNSPEPQSHSKKIRKKNNSNGVDTALSCESGKDDSVNVTENCLKNGGESRVGDLSGVKPALMNLQETWSQEASLKKKKGKGKSVNEKSSSKNEMLDSPTFTDYLQLKEIMSNKMHVMENISPNHQHHNKGGDGANETVIYQRPQLQNPKAKSTNVSEDLRNVKNHYEGKHPQNGHLANNQERSLSEFLQKCTKRKNKKDSSANGSPTHPVSQKTARNEPEVNTNRKANAPAHQGVRSALTNQTNHTLSPRADGKNVSPPREDCPKSPRGKGKPEQNSDRRSKNKKKKNKGQDDNSFIDDVFLPKQDKDLEHGDMDEVERELEEFKRFCLDSTPARPREKIPVNVNLKDIFSKKK